ncbi:hypothetical protein DMN91_000327 [Ooceraea biroi]|uniref:Uncharacterized protein n=1 Tax=Ooceraea biroi TaxID=2015173 RepID=A0A3L8E1C4_OOCBI|nr:hypothetical protein DMN91_000327 [Ooceraea biroi]
MDRRYQRVGLGVGAFHNPPRARYSDETKNLIELLMEESKLTVLQKKTIQEAVEKGESLPPSIDVMKTNQDYVQDDGIRLPNTWRRRSRDTIVSSGAYEREQYRRTAPLHTINFVQLANKEKQKRHLACMMAYGKDMPETPRGPKILHGIRRDPQTSENVQDPLNELIRGIRERMDFLRDMENLGLGKKYRPMMQQEIAQKIRLIESMDKRTCNQLRKEIRQLSHERPSPKPFPLGEFDED